MRVCIFELFELWVCLYLVLARPLLIHAYCEHTYDYYVMAYRMKGQGGGGSICMAKSCFGRQL
ncbi:hypothetical protein AG1IA_09599 [Rhizoctonia solani AG-1 IA]|uniref:Secreted protein n=1 Tax=Thanatephorus cucumeris (strain AG1-IA) TaxID=983506 RepID=L8WDX5_THACA|nr:hypothetical protein AG1IA_09599 [Rhizoctonia solani AG-1 IA]